VREKKIAVDGTRQFPPCIAIVGGWRPGVGPRSSRNSIPYIRDY
jgi:hypothetical protein